MNFFRISKIFLLKFCKRDETPTKKYIGTIIHYRPKNTIQKQMDLEKGIAKIQLKVTTDLRESMGDEAATFIEKTQDADFINSMEKLVKKDFEIDPFQEKVLEDLLQSALKKEVEGINILKEHYTKASKTYAHNFEELIPKVKVLQKENPWWKNVLLNFNHHNNSSVAYY